MGKSNSVGSMSARDRGIAKKKENAAKKREEDLERHEQQEQKRWAQGSDTRGLKRAEEQEQRMQEQEQKRREKKLLEEQEEAQYSNMTKPKKKDSKKSEQERQLQELYLKEQEKNKTAKVKQKEEQKKKKAEEDKLFTRRNEDGEDIEIGDDDLPPLEQNLNRQLGTDISSSGIDGALENLDIDAKKEIPNSKALFKAFRAREMDRIKEENPRLRKPQIEDKVYRLWTRSAENPLNQGK